MDNKCSEKVIYLVIIVPKIIIKLFNIIDPCSSTYEERRAGFIVI